MSEHQSTEPDNTAVTQDSQVDRREFLGSLGKWSGASVAAVIGSAAWLSTSGSSQAASWVNRSGGGWINRRSGGGSWINGGGGGWVNRGGSWVNRGGGGWINRRR